MSFSPHAALRVVLLGFLAILIVAPCARRKRQAGRTPHARRDGGGFSGCRTARTGRRYPTRDRRLQGRQGRRLYFLHPRYHRGARLFDDAVRCHRRRRCDRAHHRRQGGVSPRTVYLPRCGAPALAGYVPRPRGRTPAARRRYRAAAGFRFRGDHQRAGDAGRYRRPRPTWCCMRGCRGRPSRCRRSTPRAFS